MTTIHLLGEFIIVLGIVLLILRGFVSLEKQLKRLAKYSDQLVIDNREMRKLGIYPSNLWQFFRARRKYKKENYN